MLLLHNIFTANCTAICGLSTSIKNEHDAAAAAAADDDDGGDNDDDIVTLTVGTMTCVVGV